MPAYAVAVGRQQSDLACAVTDNTTRCELCSSRCLTHTGRPYQCVNTSLLQNFALIPDSLETACQCRSYPVHGCACVQISWQLIQQRLGGSIMESCRQQL